MNEEHQIITEKVIEHEDMNNIKLPEEMEKEFSNGLGDDE